MDDIIYTVMYTLPFSYPELVSIHRSEEGAKNSRDKMNAGNTSLTQKYVIRSYTVEK